MTRSKSSSSADDSGVLLAGIVERAAGSDSTQVPGALASVIYPRGALPSVRPDSIRTSEKTAWTVGDIIGASRGQMRGWSATLGPKPRKARSACGQVGAGP